MCKSCYGAAYCGRDCQVQHWKASHKRYCKSLAIKKFVSLIESIGGTEPTMAWLRRAREAAGDGMAHLPALTQGVSMAPEVMIDCLMTLSRRLKKDDNPPDIIGQIYILCISIQAIRYSESHGENPAKMEAALNLLDEAICCMGSMDFENVVSWTEVSIAKTFLLASMGKWQEASSVVTQELHAVQGAQFLPAYLKREFISEWHWRRSRIALIMLHHRNDHKIYCPEDFIAECVVDAENAISLQKSRLGECVGEDLPTDISMVRLFLYGLGFACHSHNQFSPLSAVDQVPPYSSIFGWSTAAVPCCGAVF